MPEKGRAGAKQRRRPRSSRKPRGGNAQTAPPKDLSPRGRRIWGKVIAYLESEDLFRAAQVEMIELYVRAVVRALEFREVADKEPTVKGSQGQPVANPAAKTAQDAEATAHRWAEALLITPAAIRRHLKGEEDGDDEDGLGF